MTLSADQGFIVDTAVSAPVYGGMLVPHSVDAEQALLGALVIDPAQMIECGYLHSQDFYITHNKYLYQAMKDLFERHNGYDWVTLTEHLETAGHLADIGGPGALADLVNMTPTSFGGPEYARIIYQHSIARQVLERVQLAAQAAYQPVIGRTGDMLVNEVISSFTEIDATRNVSGGPLPMKSGAIALLERREMIMENGGLLPGVMTGIKTLDSILDGLEKKRLILLAGRPGMGKSALVLQFAYNMAISGKRVLLYSLEMEEIEITARLASIHCGLKKIAYKDILAGRGDDSAICQAIDFISRLPVLKDCSPGLTVAQIRSRTQKVMMSEDIDIVMVDHGGLVVPTRYTGKSYSDTNDVAADMQRLPKQLDLPVLCLVQLSRAAESRGPSDKKPKLTDLRDSGHWEQHADCVLFINRDQYHNPDTEYPHLGEIIVAKNRAGASAGTATVYADVATNRFMDLDTRSGPQ